MGLKWIVVEFYMHYWQTRIYIHMHNEILFSSDMLYVIVVSNNPFLVYLFLVVDFYVI